MHLDTYLFIRCSISGVIWDLLFFCFLLIWLLHSRFIYCTLQFQVYCGFICRDCSLQTAWLGFGDALSTDLCVQGLLTLPAMFTSSCQLATTPAQPLQHVYTYIYICIILMMTMDKEIGCSSFYFIQLGQSNVTQIFPVDETVTRTD